MEFIEHQNIKIYKYDYLISIITVHTMLLFFLIIIKCT